MTAIDVLSPVATIAAARPRAARVALGALQAIIAVIYLFSGFQKVSLDPQAVAGFAAMGLGNVGCVIIGSLELLGVVGILVPRLAGLTATAYTALMIGATTAMTLIGGGVLIAIPVVVLVLVAAVAIVRRHETATLVRSVVEAIRR